MSRRRQWVVALLYSLDTIYRCLIILYIWSNKGEPAKQSTTSKNCPVQQYRCKTKFVLIKLLTLLLFPISCFFFFFLPFLQWSDLVHFPFDNESFTILISHVFYCSFLLISLLVAPYLVVLPVIVLRVFVHF